MLKRIALILAAVAMLQGVALAAIGTTYVQITDAAFTNLGIVFKPSNNVEVMYIDDNAGAPQAYTIASKHTSGDRIYSTSNLSTSIYYKAKDASNGVIPGAALSTLTGQLPTAAGESLYGTGWTAQ